MSGVLRGAGWVLAHGVGGRADLPIPLWLAQYGAAAALVASFVVLGLFWRTPRLQPAADGATPTVPPADGLPGPGVRMLLRLVGVALAGVTLAAAAFGPGTSAANPSPTWVYVWFWVGLVPASLLLGPVWRWLNPLRGITVALERLTGDTTTDQARRPLPAGVGLWPAAAGLGVFVWLELVYPHPDQPKTVLVFLAGYALVQLLAAAVYGPGWYARGDAFEVYSTLLGHLAPIVRRPDGRLALRNPLSGLAGIPAEPGLAAVVCVLLGSTAYDGLTRTQWWSGITSGVDGAAAVLLGTAGLVGMMAVVALSYLAAIWASRPPGGPGHGDGHGGGDPGWSGRRLALAFAPSLLPIAVGYTIAHYFSLLLFQGQAGYILANDPLGLGWDLLGTRDWAVNYTLLTPRAISIIQVAAIVTGHVVGVIVAHDRAVALFPRDHRTKGQVPLLMVMVGYTVGGIGLLLGA